MTIQGEFTESNNFMKKEIKREKLFPTSHIIFNVHNWSLNARISMFKQTDFEEKKSKFCDIKNLEICSNFVYFKKMWVEISFSTALVKGE